MNCKIVVLKKTTLQFYFKTFIENINSAKVIIDYLQGNDKIELISTGLNGKIVVLKKTTLQFYFKTFIKKINSANVII